MQKENNSRLKVTKAGVYFNSRVGHFYSIRISGSNIVQIDVGANPKRFKLELPLINSFNF